MVSHSDFYNVSKLRCLLCACFQDLAVWKAAVTVHVDTAFPQSCSKYFRLSMMSQADNRGVGKILEKWGKEIGKIMITSTVSCRFLPNE
jgi:hypothetical protein